MDSENKATAQRASAGNAGCACDETVHLLRLMDENKLLREVLEGIMPLAHTGRDLGVAGYADEGQAGWLANCDAVIAAARAALAGKEGAA
jgi:hypothetical protein